MSAVLSDYWIGYLVGLAVGFVAGGIVVLLAILVFFVRIDPKVQRFLNCMLGCEHELQPSTLRGDDPTAETSDKCSRRCSPLLLDLRAVSLILRIANMQLRRSRVRA
jgi:hypothetical protein